MGSLITHGCITVLTADSTAGAQYKKLEQLLQAQAIASNKLVVVP
jgi:hypothetical protein